MSEHVPMERGRIYEGPAELYQGDGIRGDQYDERMANDGTRFFTNLYGERGIGWEFDATSHAGENSLIQFGNDIDRELSRQAVRNNDLYSIQITDAGEPVSDQQLELMNRTDPAPKGSLIVYPDGKQYFAKKFSQ